MIDELDMYLLALTIGQQLNEIAADFEHEGEIMRKEFACQADRDDFDARR